MRTRAPAHGPIQFGSRTATLLCILTIAPASAFAQLFPPILPPIVIPPINSPIEIVTADGTRRVNGNEDLRFVINNGLFIVGGSGNATELRTFTNSGRLNIDGNFTVAQSSIRGFPRLLNSGSRIDVGGTLNNSNALFNSGQINVSGSFFNNKRTINNGNGIIRGISPASRLENAGVFLNFGGDIATAGYLQNSGLLASRNGVISVNRHLTNTNLLLNRGGTVAATDMFNVGVFSNSGANAETVVAGSMLNAGVLLNTSGTLALKGESFNRELIHNRSGGTITVSGNLMNSGMLIGSDGNIRIDGTLVNQALDDPLIFRDQDGNVDPVETANRLIALGEDGLNAIVKDATTIADDVGAIALGAFQGDIDLKTPKVLIQPLREDIRENAGVIANNGGTMTVNGTLVNGSAIINRSTVGRDGTLALGGTLDNQGAILNAGATLRVKTDGELRNRGLLLNRNKLLKSGELIVNGSLTNEFIFLNSGGRTEIGGLLENRGLLKNEGMISVRSSGETVNHGVMSNRTGTIQVEGRLTNGNRSEFLVARNDDGSADFAGTVELVKDAITGWDEVGLDSFTDLEVDQLKDFAYDQALYLNRGGVTRVMGQLDNNSLFTNTRGSALDVSGEFDNYGIVFNRAGNLGIEAGGSFENNRGFVNRSSLLTEGAVDIAGDFTNQLFFLNRGASVHVNADGKLLNNGLIRNESTLLRAGGFSVDGLLNNDGLLFNRDGAISIGKDGQLRNKNFLRNRSDRGVANSGATMQNAGALVNQGFLFNDGDIRNSGSFDNTQITVTAGSINNTSVNRGIENAGVLMNVAAEVSFQPDYTGVFAGLESVDGLASKFLGDLLPAPGTFENNGLFQQAGVFANFGTFTNADLSQESLEKLKSDDAEAKSYLDARADGRSAVFENSGILVNGGTGAVGLTTDYGTLSARSVDVPGFINMGLLSNDSIIANLGRLQNGKSGAFDNDSLLLNLSGSVTIQREVEDYFDLNLDMQAAGELKNAGTLTNNSDAFFVNGGAVNNTETGEFFNRGIVLNVGVEDMELRYDAPGLDVEATLGRDATIDNKGLIVNGEDLITAAQIPALLGNFGALVNREGATFRNRGLVLNAPVADLALLNQFGLDAGPGSITRGSISNNGDFLNSRLSPVISLGEFINEEQGRLVNEGLFVVTAADNPILSGLLPFDISSLGQSPSSFVNAGEYIGESGSVFNNTELVRNSGTMLFRGTASDPTLLANVGTFSNSGEVTVDGVASFLNLGLLRNTGLVEFRGPFANPGVIHNAGTLRSPGQAITNLNSLFLEPGSRVDGQLINAGTLALSAGGAGQFARVSGNFTAAPGSLMQVFINSNGNKFNYGQMSVGGSATLVASSVFLRNGQNFDWDNLVDGQRFKNIVKAGGPLIAGSIPLTVEESRPIWSFSAQTDLLRSAFDIVVRRNRLKDIVGDSSPANSAADPASPARRESDSGTTTTAAPWLGSAAASVDLLYDNAAANPDAQSILQAFNSLRSGDEVVSALAQMSPVAVSSNNEMLLRSLSTVSSVADNRLAVLRDMASSDGDRVARNYSRSFAGFNTFNPLDNSPLPDSIYGDHNVWVKVYKTWAEQYQSQDSDAFDSDTTGLFVGADGSLERGIRIGGGLSYSAQDTQHSGFASGQNVKSDLYSAVFYGDWAIGRNSFLAFNGIAGRATNESSRAVNVGDISRLATGSYDSTNTMISMSLGHALSLSSNWTVSPELGVDYINMQTDAFTERGADEFNNEVASNRLEALVFNLDGRFTYWSDKALYSLRAGLGYDSRPSNDSQSSSTLAGGGPLFVTPTPGPGGMITRAGLGVELLGERNVDFLLNYDYEARDHYQSQSVEAMLRWRF